MTESTIPSFVDAAITNTCQGKSSYAKGAALVEARNELHFANRIGGAWAALSNERKALQAVDMEDNGTRAKNMPIKPESFLSLCQYLMNQSCWAARRYIKAQDENAKQEAVNGITGIDFSQDIAADLGFEPMNIEGIKEALDSDYRTMLKLHSVLAKHMNYLPMIDDLYLYAEKEQEGENWRITATAMDFEEALPIMAEVQVKMKERDAASIVKEMAETDFAA